MKVQLTKKQILFFISLTGFLMVSFVGTQVEYPKEKIIKFVVPNGWPKPKYDFEKNPLKEGVVDLGRILFYDPILSEDSTISCASCHLQQTNFTHVDHRLSHGIYGRKGTRNSLSIVNLAWSDNFMWDGGVNHVEVQPLAPIENPAEMNSSLKIILPRLKSSEFYRNKFGEVYGRNKEITGQFVLKALAQYMLTLQSFNTKYDKVMRKEPGVVFTDREEQGLQIFRKHCASCHTEPLFTNNGFENNGLEADTFLKDGGRIKITRQISDSLKFKVPSLRNIEISYPYMHDGRFRNLQMVIFHYSEDIHHTINLSEKLQQPLRLNEQEKDALIAFLKTLTDNTFLENPDYGYKGIY